MRISFRQYWALLATYLKPQRRRTLLLGLLLACSIALQLTGPGILQQFIDRALAGEPVSTLIWLAVAFLGIALVTQVVNLGEIWVAENLGWIATNALRNDLALHVLRLDPDFHHAHTPGALIERVDGDVAKLGNFFSRFMVLVLGNGLLGCGVLIMLFRVDWRAGAALTLFSVVSLVVINRMRDFTLPHWAAEREAAANLFGFIEERLSGTEDIRAAGATDYVMRGNFQLARLVLRKQIHAQVTGSVAYSVSILLFAIGTAVALGMGAWLYHDGSITIGTVFLIYQYTNLLNQPIEQITRQLQDLQQAGASVGRIQQMLETRSSIVDGPGVPEPGEETALAVDFDEVSFGYTPDEPVVQDLDFHLAPGEVLGLVGRTGSGKTTITRLLTRMHDPSSGTVRIGGFDARHWHLASLRRQIGLVTQDIQLFRATVRDNLTLFDPEIPDSRIIATLEDLGLGTWFHALPDGLDTMLASGGGGLSAGEGQLLAFARVFLDDPRIVILDEASSRLDPGTERRLERAIDRLLAGRTAIVIAHRLSTVNRADRIMVLQQGRIVEYGDRRSLMQQPDSRFAQMLRTGQGDLDEETAEAGVGVSQ